MGVNEGKGVEAGVMDRDSTGVGVIEEAEDSGVLER